MPTAVPSDLSQCEIDASARRVSRMLNPPAGATNTASSVVVLRVSFKHGWRAGARAGSGRGPPIRCSGRAMAESAKRAFAALPAVHDAAGRSITTAWKDMEITFDPRRCSAADGRDISTIGKINMSVRDPGFIVPIDRDGAPVLAGAAAGAALAAAAFRGRRGQHRRHPGQRPADPDRDSGFRRRHAERCRRRAQHHAGDHRQPEALRPVRADRSAGLSRENRQHRRCAALRRLARHQRPGAGHRPHHPPGRRPAESRIPAVGRGLQRAARPARSISPRPTSGGGSRTSSRMRSISGSPARSATSTAASCSSTRPARRSGASSGSRSWIRTAPTCAS